MSVPFQVASLVNPPSFPNSIVWSEDNLIAVATGEIVTILNPEHPHGPRGVITLPAEKPFPVGVVDRADLLSGCLLPTCLTRDRQPCVRSLSWSPSGFTPHNGCLLAVCSTEGRVKLYRQPYCEFQAEWIELMDLSDMLHGYFAKITYGEPEVSSQAVVTTNIASKPERKRKRDKNLNQEDLSCTEDGRDHLGGTTNNNPKQLITAKQYISRFSMLASCVVSWSPVLQLSSTFQDNLCDFCSLLAIGTKSGNISIWRIHRPPYYSIEPQDEQTTTVLLGVIQAHNAWVTALCWGLISTDSSPQVLLASGCSHGSVKIWLGCGSKLSNMSETEDTPFSLITEVTAGDTILVSALSLYLPVQLPHKIFLAVGEGSGSIEVWTCNIKNNISKKVESYNAHVQVVTGLVWAFDGHCIYSCSLDNSVHGWIYHKGSLSKVSIPPNSLGNRSFSDLPSVSDSCYGLAISPGNMALAVARRFDAEQLDPMYQKRTQRAAVEFFWIGGQQVDISSTPNVVVGFDTCPGFSKDELESWGSKLLWSLNHYKSHDKHLFLWDILAAFQAFKQCAPKFFKHTVFKWFELLFEHHLNPFTDDIFSDVSGLMSKIPSRLLHLLNIFCRRVLLSSGFDEAKLCKKSLKFAKSYSIEEESQIMDLLLNSEQELRERLVGISLSTFSSHLSNLASKEKYDLWNPDGIAQMLKWVFENCDRLQHQLNALASEVKGVAERLHTATENGTEEQCCFCSAIIPFESPEIAFCHGIMCSDGEAIQKHKLARCSVSMQVCPFTSLWLCVCCKRQAFKLPPYQLFTMPEKALNFMLDIKPVINNLDAKPWCPFCGISLQRQQPDFLLSSSPI